MGLPTTGMNATQTNRISRSAFKYCQNDALNKVD